MYSITPDQGVVAVHEHDATHKPLTNVLEYDTSLIRFLRHGRCQLRDGTYLI